MPELIKIDVEGFEFEVLLGMANIINENHPSILIEIHPVNMEYYGQDISIKIREFFHSLNYGILDLNTHRNSVKFIFAFYDLSKNV